MLVSTGNTFRRYTFVGGSSCAPPALAADIADAALSTLPTEVFVGRQFWYPTQFQWKVEPGGSMTGKFNATTSLLSLHYADTALPPSVTVSVWGH